MQEELFQKTHIYIDSESAEYKSADKCIFTIDLLESLKDVEYIYILNTDITLVKSNSKFMINEVELDTLSDKMDNIPIFVMLNDYKRITTVVSKDNTMYNAKYFERIVINKSKVLDSNKDVITFQNSSQTTFHPNNVNVHVMNPVESKLKKLNFELRDKNDNTIDKKNISHFSMTLCIYQNYRKVSRV